MACRRPCRNRITLSAWRLRSCCCVIGLLLPGAVYPAPNAAPSVWITAPLSGSQHDAPASISIEASASDPDGSVVKVDFFSGTQLLGTDTTSPYSLVWSTAEVGNYSLTARATDNKGKAKTSAAISVSVASASIAITSPPSGAITNVFDSPVVAVKGNYVGDPATATVIVSHSGRSQLADVSEQSFSANVVVVPGDNTITATVSRPDRTSSSATVRVQGDLPLVLAVTAPADTSFYAPADVHLEATVLSPDSAISSVEFWRDGTPLATVTRPPYAFTHRTSQVGAASYGIKAVDSKGRTVEDWIPISIYPPNAAPAVAITSPTSGSNFFGTASVAVSATASDSDGYVKSVQFFADGALAATDSTAPFNASVAGLALGTHTLSARATDEDGGSGDSAAVSINMLPANELPSVSLQVPTGTETYFDPATVALVAAAEDRDGAVSRVEFYAGNTLIGTAYSSPYAAEWNAAPAGTFSLYAKAIDDLGGSSLSSPVSITVRANARPTIVLTSPADRVTTFEGEDLFLSATAADSDGTVSQVEFYSDGTLVGTSSAAPHGLTWRSIPAGDHDVHAVAVDDRGAKGESAVVRVAATRPGAVITAPTGSFVHGARTIVSGIINAPPNSGVTVNDRVAALFESGAFYADIPLVEGTNPITVSINTQNGGRYVQSFSVSSDGMPSWLVVEFTSMEGVAPTETLIKATHHGRGEATYRLNSGDPITLKEGESALLSVAFSEPYVYPFTAAAVDSEGNSVSEQFVFVAHDRTKMDVRFRSLWSQFHSHMSGGDKQRVMTFMSPGVGEMLDPALDELMSGYSAVTATFLTFEPGQITPDSALYGQRVQGEGETHLYFVEFGRDELGIWRLISM